ncbi:low affinity immunoglobulin gamma Fc region receptor III-like [Astatotilapia calliptera]|uniref:low affinity immunoglobulin gamma Fc region receptor III-like n=1 Tax=Astatotilapia calliptera TaxID=8154 RepID=UPI000E41DE5B|nr:low affinity immunoglobulin gamma Fc region receptor III-like [Astatotilapia calliptera]
MLLVAYVVSDSAFQILPSRLQLFEYESVYFTCNGFNISAEWKVRNIEQIVSKCSTNTTMKTCTIDYAFVSDSGEYWCESGAERSDTINITVSTGSVILESPVHPVLEGEVVNLYCRNKTTSSNFTAYFYKDNLLIGISFEGEVTVQNVSKSHKGFYKCKIHGVGESPESWLAIKSKHSTKDMSSFCFIVYFVYGVCIPFVM